ncbi:MAG: hypothetical protein KDK28_12160 [Maritimibacter sp.]|nr:hypothetical protein [Maritimibacter sp.]
MGGDEPRLGPGKPDRVAALLRAVAGGAPFVGAALNELITVTIPGVRQSRIEEYLIALRAKLEVLSEEQLRLRVGSDLALDLIEEGAYQAVRALTEERRDQITNAVAFGLCGRKSELLEAKRILQLLKELDDAQVIILASKLMKNSRDDEFRSRHANVLETVFPSFNSTREELDRGIVQDMGKQKLLSLGLIRQNFTKVRKGELPTFDGKTGMVKSTGTDITPLGLLLLRRIGLADEADY